jgi:hypothetical protein
MATVFEDYTTEEQRSVVRFFVGERIFIKKCFLFMLGSVCSIKRFHLGGKRFAADEEVETEVRKWLRQLSKDFCTAGSDVLIKGWDKCINVGGRYVEKYMLLSHSNITCFTFYIHL